MKRTTIEGMALTRAITAEQINQQAGSEGFNRLAEVREIDEQARTVDLAFSSEYPVPRFFGDEVLSHDPGSMDTSRLEDGAALLVNHDWDDQIGVVESVEIGDDRRGRAKVRFGRGARASEIWQDVVDGIRRHVSVGYSISKVEVEDRQGQPDLVRVTRWHPYEISLVTVPADPTSGVGRSMEKPPEEPNGAPADDGARQQNPSREEPVMNEKILRDAQGNLVRAKVDEHGAIVEVLETIERADDGIKHAQRQASDAERSRVRAIMEMGEQYGAEDLARDYARDGKSPEEMQRALLDKLNQRGNKPLADESGAGIGMSDNEVRQFSFMKAIRAMANPTDRRAQDAAAFEFEASRAAAERAGKEPEGILVPQDVLSRALNTSTSGSAAGDTGGYSVATELMSSSFIELLRNRTVLMQLASPMGGLVGNADIPKQESGASGYWIGEDDDAPEDNAEMGQVGMSPKTVAALTQITRRLMMQSSLDVEALVRSDLARALALAIDKAGFYGTGSSNQPLGIANVSGINAVDFSAANPTYTEAVKMESEIAADNADVNSMAYVMNSGMRGHFKTTQKFDGTDGAPIWEPGNTVNGYGAEVTNQIDAGDVFFGNFADLIIAMWGGLDLTVDPYTQSQKGRLRITAMQDVDFAVRRTESFCLGRNSG